MNVTTIYHPERIEFAPKIKKSDLPVEHLSFRMDVPEVEEIAADLDDSLDDVSLGVDEMDFEKKARDAKMEKAKQLSEVYTKCSTDQRRRISSRIVTNIQNKFGYGYSDLSNLTGCSVSTIINWANEKCAVTPSSFASVVFNLLDDGIPYMNISPIVWAVFRGSGQHMADINRSRRPAINIPEKPDTDLPVYQFPEEGEKQAEEPQPDVINKDKLSKMMSKVSAAHKQVLDKWMFEKAAADPEFSKLVEKYFWEDI